ncbi:MAG: GEVED domain-containing protein [Pseudomonadota bacterium]
MRLSFATLVLLSAVSHSTLAYCPASGSNATYEFIDAVTVDGVEVLSGNNNGYQNHPTPIVVNHRTFAIELSPGYSGYNYQEAWSVWIDLDGSGSFDTHERVFSGTSNQSINTTVTLPNTAVDGEIGMRISMSYGSAQTDPCASFGYGEVEDYVIDVPVIDGTPGNPAPDSEQTPWQSIAPANSVSGINWRYAMGYHFVPTVDGQITGLGGKFGGTKTVRLYHRETGEKLAELSVTSEDQWSYATLTDSIDVAAGDAYTVAVYLNGSGGTYQYGPSVSFPVSSGDIDITSSTYVATGTTVDPEVAPTNDYSYAMLGVADVRFTPDAAGGSALSLNCVDNEFDDLPAAGVRNIGPLLDFIPLCDGVVLVGDRADNTVKAIDVVDGEVLHSWSLGAPPGAMTSDPNLDVVYVALSEPAQLVSIDLATNAVQTLDIVDTSIADPTHVYDLTLVGDGNVLAVVQDGPTYNWTDRPVAIINPADGEIVSVFEPGSNGRGATLLEYDEANNQVIAGDEGNSPSSLLRYDYDGNTLIEADYRWNAGSNGQDLAISSDGEHLAFASGGGNGSGYTVFDFDPSDLSNTNGEWVVGAYPRTVDFSPAGGDLAASDGADLQIFDVDTKLLVHTMSPDLSGCSYSQVKRVRHSRDGAIVFGFSNCGFDDDSARIFWTVSP